MGAYLSIVSGAIKLFNYLAAALQQHHDELNGANNAVGQINKATLDETQAVNDARADTANLQRVREQSLRD